MKYIAEHFGPAMIAFAIFITLGALIVGMLSGGGYVAQQFQNALQNFFTGMNNIPGV